MRSITGLMGRAQDTTVRFKEIHHLTTRDRQVKRTQALLQRLMHFIHRLMIAQTKVTNQDHHIQAKRETG